MVVLDVLYFCSRTLFHGNKELMIDKILAILLIFMNVEDLCSIIAYSSTVKIRILQTENAEIQSKSKSNSDDSKANLISVTSPDKKGKAPKKSNTGQKVTQNAQQSQKPKILDQEKMIKKLKFNETLDLYCVSELRKDKKFDTDFLILASNLSFLLRLLVMNTVIVGLPHSPILQLVLLLMTELAYSGISILKYVT
jgi:hypothetical protein